MPLPTYGRLCTEVYDLDKPDVPAEALLFYMSRLHASKGPVLEPMCGSGRFLIPMMELGVDIDGVDASAHMLNACRSKCEVRGLKPRLYEQLLQDLDLPRKYGFVFIPAGSFGLITDPPTIRACLDRLREHMLPGGRLVMEVETPYGADVAPGQWIGSWLTRSDGAKLLSSFLHTKFDASSRTSSTLARYELIVDGQVADSELEEYPLRYYEQEEMRALLEAAGFHDVRIARVFGNDPPAEDAASFVAECVRPDDD